MLKKVFDSLASIWGSLSAGAKKRFARRQVRKIAVQEPVAKKPMTGGSRQKIQNKPFYEEEPKEEEFEEGEGESGGESPENDEEFEEDFGGEEIKEEQEQPP